jgi:hypothetical protein
MILLTLKSPNVSPNHLHNNLDVLYLYNYFIRTDKMDEEVDLDEFIDWLYKVAALVCKEMGFK